MSTINLHNPGYPEPLPYRYARVVSFDQRLNTIGLFFEDLLPVAKEAGKDALKSPAWQEFWKTRVRQDFVFAQGSLKSIVSDAEWAKESVRQKITRAELDRAMEQVMARKAKSAASCFDSIQNAFDQLRSLFESA